MIDCRNLTFSPDLAKQRQEKAMQIFAMAVLKRILCFALYLLGAKRNEIAAVLDMPFESLKTTLRSVHRKGLPAFEDRRQKHSNFLPLTENAPSQATIHKDADYFIIKFSQSENQLKIPQKNPLQVKTILLSLINSGLLQNTEVSDVLNLTPFYVGKLAKQLEENDVIELQDKRQGQTKDYQVTMEVKAQLIQEFAAHVITGRSTSSIVLAKELNKCQGCKVSDRSIRVHVLKLGLSTIVKSLPELISTVKKKFNSIILQCFSQVAAKNSLNLKSMRCSAMQNRVVRRAQIVALHQSGIEKSAISTFVDCSNSTVYRWTSRVYGNKLRDKERSGRPVTFDNDTQLRLIGFYCQTPPLAKCGRWSIRWADKHLKAYPEILGIPISCSSIQRLLKKHHLKPHLTKYFLQITDPDFFPKMEHLLELFNNQPDYLYFFDECPGIQILMRIAPDMTTERQQKWLNEFEYNRNGTLDVLAFLKAKTGKVFAECTFDHKSVTINRIFETHVNTQPSNVQLHYVMDNLSSHCNESFVNLIARLSDMECPKLKTAKERREWLQSDQKRIVVHFTPFHGSWLNWVEIWFGILNQKCLKASFDSAESLIAAIYKFLDIWNSLLAHPFNWKYDGKGLHEKAVTRFIQVLSRDMGPVSIKFFKKQFLLINNLASTYRGKISNKIWVQLNELLQLKQDYLRNIIENDDKPRRRADTNEALNDLLEILSSFNGS